MQCAPPSNCTIPGFVLAPNNEIKESVVFLQFKATVGFPQTSFKTQLLTTHLTWYYVLFRILMPLCTKTTTKISERKLVLPTDAQYVKPGQNVLLPLKVILKNSKRRCYDFKYLKMPTFFSKKKRRQKFKANLLWRTPLYSLLTRRKRSLSLVLMEKASA